MWDTRTTRAASMRSLLLPGTSEPKWPALQIPQSPSKAPSRSLWSNGHTVTRENYGHGQINKGFPLGDALKTAAVDAQKKCCSMFGIGLHLYDGDDQPGQHHATSGNGQHRGHDNGHYDPPPAFNDDLGHDYHADPNPPAA